MKIAALSNTSLDPTLGSGKTRLAWSSGLRDLGHEVDVFPPEAYYNPWPGDKGRRIKMRLDALSLKTQLFAGNYDLIEFYGAEFAFLIDSLAKVPRDRRPLLVAHTDGLELLAKTAYDSLGDSSYPAHHRRWTTRLVEPTIAKWDVKAFSRVDAFAAICQADVDFMMEQSIQPANRCVTVEPGVDEIYLRAPWQRPKQSWLISLGSWTGRKDPATTVNVASSLLSQNPDLEFHVLGASGAREVIVRSFADPLRARVIVHPRLPEAGMVEVLSQAKVLLFPSLYEGFGLATAEAMACGCAVVVTPTGFGSSIRDGVDGFVCNFRDAETMRARCQTLLNDEQLRQRISSAGRERVKELTWQHQVHALESIYKHWLKTL